MTLATPATVPVRRYGKQSRTALAAGAVLFLVTGIFSAVMIGASQQDYTAYTARATATVTDVVRSHAGSSSSDASPTYDYYVDFEADGQTFTHRSLSGVIMGRPRVGDTLTVIFPPGEPGRAVTEQTASPTAQRVELWIGLGLALVAVGVLAGAIAFARAHRTGTRPDDASGPEGAGARDVAAVPTVAPADPATLPVPWPWEQVVAQLAEAAQDAPFAVTPLAGGAVDVTYDVADARWFTLLQAHGLTSTLVCRLSERKPGRYARRDTLFDVEWSAGAGSLRGQGAVQSGWVWQRRRRIDYGIGTDGSVGRQVDVTFRSSDVPQWIGSVLEGSGWRAALDTEARIALGFAAFGGVVALGAGVVALIAAF